MHCDYENCIQCMYNLELCFNMQVEFWNKHSMAVNNINNKLVYCVLNVAYTFFTVKHVAEMFIWLWVFADECKYPFVRFIVSTEGYPVQLTIVQYILQKKTQKYYTASEYDVLLT